LNPILPGARDGVFRQGGCGMPPEDRPAPRVPLREHLDERRLQHRLERRDLMSGTDANHTRFGAVLEPIALVSVSDWAQVGLWKPTFELARPRLPAAGAP